MCVKLDDKQLVDVLCFISCVALMKNGWYVDYSKLEQLMHEMPTKQPKLKSLEILSKLLMGNFNKFQLFRLHENIPFRIGMQPPKEDSINKRKANEPEAQMNTDLDVETDSIRHIISDELEMETCIIDKREPLCLPLVVGVKRKWEAAELEALHTVSSGTEKSLSEQYEEFKAQCKSRNIPFRIFKAFKRKLNRL